MSTSVLVVDMVSWLVASLSLNIRRINLSLQTKDEVDDSATHSVDGVTGAVISSQTSTQWKRRLRTRTLFFLVKPLTLLPFFSYHAVLSCLDRALNELAKIRSKEGVTPYQYVLPMTAWKMIAREVELEQMRRNKKKVLT